MKSKMCEMFGIDVPIFAFSHCRDVVVEVSKAGGMGVLGMARMSPERVEEELNWIDAHIDGKPYGIDVLMPSNLADSSDMKFDPDKLLPKEHVDFVRNMLDEAGVPPLPEAEAAEIKREIVKGMNFAPKESLAMIETAMKHPIKLIVNALGVPPDFMMEQARANGVAVGALTGAREHALKHAEAGVDILIVSGTEAGGHCGEVSTMVLVPEVLETIKPYPHMFALAAGGIATGRQMAACMAMGAAGVWTGSVWLTTAEAETTPTVKEKMLAASSSDTVRARSRTGKHSRQLRSPWTDAWEREDAPDPLAMPLQSLISEPALGKVERLSEGGHRGAQDLATYWVGQGVGLMNASQSVRNVVYDFKEDFINAHERLSKAVGT